MKSTAHMEPSPCEQAKASPEEAPPSCFLRPRFYSGQLLTEADLARLDQYMVGKQRFYNRHFHDWGVVCGLVVSCDACNAQNVHVSAGYAIGPAGQDIVTLDETIDVCELLCRDDEPDNPCAHLGPVEDKNDAFEQWLLSVHYKETPLHIPPAMTPAVDCCNTACPPAPCEPNAVCEQYEFQLTPFDTDPSGEKSTYGFFPSTEACFDELKRIFSLPVSGETNTERAARLQTWKATLGQSDAIDSATSCELAEQLAALDIPEVPDGDDPAELEAAEAELVRLHLDVWMSCLCNAMHPTCPTFASGGVPLATIITRRSECEVLSICNWGGRKTARTLPQLDYWLAPMAERMAQLAALLCCDRREVIATILTALSTAMQRRSAASSSQTSTSKQETGGLYRAEIWKDLAPRPDDHFDPREKAFLADRLVELVERGPARLAYSDMLSPALALALSRTGLAEGALNRDANAALHNQIRELTARLDKLEQQTRTGKS